MADDRPSRAHPFRLGIRNRKADGREHVRQLPALEMHQDFSIGELRVFPEQGIYEGLAGQFCQHKL